MDRRCAWNSRLCCSLSSKSWKQLPWAAVKLPTDRVSAARGVRVLTVSSARGLVAPIEVLLCWDRFLRCQPTPVLCR